MGMLADLAWRNIWRNKKRSLISIASIMFAVVLALATRSMQLGFYARSIDNVVSFYTGYIQIHAPGYFEKQSLDNSFILTDSLTNKVATVKDVKSYAPRLESFVLVSAGQNTVGSMIIGIDPQNEAQFTGLDKRVTSGDYLKTESTGIMLSEGLAEHLKVRVGDTVVALGQGYHEVLAADQYRVVAIVSFPLPDLNAATAYLTIGRAQKLFSMENRVTSLAIMLKSQRSLSGVISDLKGRLDDRYEVLSWEEMMPELVQYIETDNASGILMLLIIYLVIGFGIMGTVLMMTLERNREFGMLIAIGMKRHFLGLVVAFESIILSVIGVICGTLIGLPILVYLYYHPLRFTGETALVMIKYGFEPVFPFSLNPSIFFWQAVTVLIIALAVSIYPLWRISRLNPVSAIRTAGA
jgi:ABC-type lipoprotein release transport system permease subunit